MKIINMSVVIDSLSNVLNELKKLQDEIGILNEQISLMQCSTISSPNNPELHRSTKLVPQATKH